ncbi:hypothetical protein ACNOYE_14255 [Nannocystaceae bacterium ST9]
MVAMPGDRIFSEDGRPVRLELAPLFERVTLEVDGESGCHASVVDAMHLAAVVRGRGAGEQLAVDDAAQQRDGPLTRFGPRRSNHKNCDMLVACSRAHADRLG